MHLNGTTSCNTMMDAFYTNPLCQKKMSQCTVQKISILPAQRRLEFPGGRVSVRPKNAKRCMPLNGVFRGVGVGKV